MNNLQMLLSDIPDPVFIVSMNKRISCVNDAALSGCGEENPVGSSLEDVVYIAEKTSDESLAFFNNEWLDITRKSFQWSGKPYDKVALHQRKTVLDDSTLDVVRNMIAVLLHRLRSPLTGLQGYHDLIGADLKKDGIRTTGTDSLITKGGRSADHKAEVLNRHARNADLNLERCDKIHQGIQHLFDILDNLEILNNIPSNSEQPVRNTASYNTSPEDSLRNVLLKYPPEIREQITVRQPAAGNFDCSPAILENVLKILLDNAVENSPGAVNEITVELSSPHAVRITNGGPPIPESILPRLFFPFVTTKANSLGLGLTIAQMIASRQKGTLFLTENSRVNGISFTFRLPPGRPSASGS